MTRLTCALVLIAGCSLVGCSGSKAAKEVAVGAAVAPAEPWGVTSFNPKEETAALLWNGLIGLRFPNSGESAQAFSIASYQRKGEEKILPFPNALAGAWSGASSIKGYEQRLDFKSGKLLRKWTQTDGSGELAVEQRVWIHPDRSVAASQWKLKSDKPLELEFLLPAGVGLGNEASAEGTRSLRGRYGSVEAALHEEVEGGDGDATWISGSQPGMQVRLTPGRELVFSQVLELGKSSIRGSERAGAIAGEIRSASARRWASRWETDIEIDGPVEDQQVVRSFLFYLRSGIHPEGEMSISPMGLSSDIYFGHVFWDADLWVFPALSFIEPELAKRIVDYRLTRLPQARSNFSEWVAAGRPTGKGKVLGSAPTTGGAKFPWESSVTGKETVPGPSKYQDHITGTVAFATQRAADLGLVGQDMATELGTAAAGFFLARSERGAGGELEIKGTMSPDEHHTGDNDLYTNALAQWCRDRYRPDVKAQFRLPKDEKSFLTYDNDALRGYKQAAAVLAIYPLQHKAAEEQARVMMDRFSGKVTKNGPAMTDSVHATIWARLGEREKAYEAWHRSWKEFVKPPFLLFSEKRNSSRTYFTTGAGGALQTVIYGFAGLRVDDRRDPTAKWSAALKSGKWLNVKPNLPPAWKQIRLKGFWILGKRVTLTITNEAVSVQPS